MLATVEVERTRMRYRHAILAGPFSQYGIHGYEHLELQDDQPILGDEEIDG